MCRCAMAMQYGGRGSEFREIESASQEVTVKVTFGALKKSVIGRPHGHKYILGKMATKQSVYVLHMYMYTMC
jgi:hypothetical protein